jgi:HD-like signal output (HDOD) protein/ActR/RegA family two-component response regulator
VLFVDDETAVLDGLRRLLYPTRNEWHTAFADSGPKALALLAQETYDVVITDIRMPGMDGTELLGLVAERYPHALRIVLSGQADQDLTLKAAASAHQYLSKPCDADTLKRTIARASALKEILEDPSLKALVGRAASLPSAPAIYMELVQELDSARGSIDTVACIIARDPAMTAKILQLANSAFFGLRRHVGDLREAIVHLGFETIKALTLTLKVFHQFDASSRSSSFVECLAHHSVATGALAKRIATIIGMPKQDIDCALMAGLLHDIGKLVLMDAMPDEYGRIIRVADADKERLEEAEQVALGGTQSQVGTYLLWLWGLSDDLVEAVLYHHSPGRCPSSRASPLTAVHIANSLCLASAMGHEDRRQEELDESYLESLGLSADLLMWQELLEVAEQEQQLG